MKIYRSLQVFMIAVVLISTLFTSCKKADSGYVTLLSPADSSGHVLTSQIFSCSPVVGAAYYSFCFYDPSGTVFCQNSKTDSLYLDITPIRAGGLYFNPGETYHWQVNAKMPDSSVVSSGLRVFTLVAANSNGPVPVIHLPVSGASNVCLSPTFSWSPISGTNVYDIQISTDPFFSTILITQRVFDTTFSFSSPVISSNTNYYWRVAVGGTFTYATSAFSTEAPPAPTSPSDGSFGVSLRPTLIWPGSSCAENYTIEMADNGAFSPLLFSLPATGNSFTIPASYTLASQKTYYVRIKIVSDHSANSSRIHFTTM